MDAIYTMKDWERDGTLNVQVGQTISDLVFLQLRDCVPPAHLSSRTFQVGEPADHDRNTFAPLFTTFRQFAEGWVYVGLKPLIK